MIALVLSIAASILLKSKSGPDPEPNNKPLIARRSELLRADESRATTQNRATESLQARASTLPKENQASPPRARQVAASKAASDGKALARAPSENESASGEDFKKFVEQAYDQMLNPNTHRVMDSPFAAAHKLVEKEDVDPSWANGANQSLADAYSDFAGRVDVSMINCRTDICELRMNSLPGSDYEADLRDVQSRLQSIKQQPWFQASFDEATFATQFFPDQLPVMVIFITRK